MARTREALMLAATGFAASLALGAPQAAERSGREVVEAVCGACHATGANGAPRIGDQRAWTPRAAQGLTSLTRHAIEGIRKMPPHGGNPGVTDFEIQLAITYMVNHSGGHWAVPIDTAAPLAPPLSGERIVGTQCVKCHGAGVGGAPRIGDRAAWIPRLQHGLEPLVRSAIQGHGGMPPRGGMANLTDSEIRSAIAYMFDAGANVAKAEAPATAAASAPEWNHRVVGGMDVYLGVVSAQALRAEHLKAGSSELSMHGGIPGDAAAYYHVNVSLLDGATHAPIPGAQVSASVTDPVTGGETKELEPMTIAGSLSYGNYFRILGANAQSITVRIKRPGIRRPVSTRFTFSR